MLDGPTEHVAARHTACAVFAVWAVHPWLEPMARGTCIRTCSVTEPRPGLACGTWERYIRTCSLTEELCLSRVPRRFTVTPGPRTSCQWAALIHLSADADSAHEGGCATMTNSSPGVEP